jgi:G3E family GTPase
VTASAVPVPVLLVTGFLGAGKTTLINHILANPDGRRLAAVVNDFGAINIDAELIGGAADGVVSLANGCICCSLQGDLLRTIAMLLRRAPRPDGIVIETSGIADPGDVVRTLMDPVIWGAAPLETVLCVVDAGRPEILDDALCRAQLAAADVIVLAKTDEADPALTARTRAAAASRPAAVLVEAAHGRIPLELLFSTELDAPPTPRATGRRSPAAERFETMSWSASGPVSLARLQTVIGQIAARLVRAKGLIETLEYPGQPLLLQFVAGRATLTPAAPAPAGAPPVRMVFIAELGRLDRTELSRRLDATMEYHGRSGGALG